MSKKEKQKKPPDQENLNHRASPVCYMDQFPEYFFGATKEKEDRLPAKEKTIPNEKKPPCKDI